MPGASGGDEDGGACRCSAVHGLLDWSVSEDNLVELRFVAQDGEHLIVAVPTTMIPRLIMALMEMGNEAARQRAFQDAGVLAGLGWKQAERRLLPPSTGRLLPGRRLQGGL